MRNKIKNWNITWKYYIIALWNEKAKEDKIRKDIIMERQDNGQNEKSAKIRLMAAMFIFGTIGIEEIYYLRKNG